jgi:MarR family transcriptional regulator, organic hydroperoxide resistance regulator
LILREAHENDRRLLRLRLTEDGIRLMEKIYPEFNSVESELVAGLSDRKVATFTRILRELVTHVEGEVESA